MGSLNKRVIEPLFTLSYTIKEPALQQEIKMNTKSSVVGALRFKRKDYDWIVPFQEINSSFSSQGVIY